MNRIWFYRMSWIFGLMLLCACQKEHSGLKVEEAGVDAATPVVVNQAPVLSKTAKLGMHESPTEFLPEAMRLRGATLVLFADNPLLAPLPEAVRNELGQVLVGQDPVRLSSRLGRIANPLLMPDMTVRAALEAKLFKHIIWVLPSIKADEQLNLAKFKELLLSAGLKSDSFRQGKSGTLTGSLEGIPFDVVHPAALPTLNGPVHLHLDLGFFIALYDNEIKTPLIPHIGSTLRNIRAKKWSTTAATFSYSNHTGRISLSMRPLGPAIEQLFARPDLLDQKMPENWELWGKILYLENFFQNEEIQRLLTKMEANEPNAAWVKYLRSNFSRHMGDTVAAERFLAEAIKGDVGYALEYMDQAEAALEAKNPEKVLANLRKLVAAMPEDPLFQLSLCDELVEQKRFDEVRAMLPALRQLPWSPVYYPQVPPTLEYFQEISAQ